MSDEDEFYNLIAKMKENLDKEKKFARGMLISGMGGLLWEEPIEEYRNRMFELGDEYLDYLKDKRQEVLDKLHKEVNELSEVINEFEIKLKEKQ